MVLLEFWACLEGEGGVEASMAKASFLCDSVPLRMVHFCPSGAVGGVVPIVPHIQAPSINTSGVHYLADTALVVGGATGIDLALLGLPGVASWGRYSLSHCRSQSSSQIWSAVPQIWEWLGCLGGWVWLRQHECGEH